MNDSSSIIQWLETLNIQGFGAQPAGGESRLNGFKLSVLFSKPMQIKLLAEAHLVCLYLIIYGLF
jgi:hypothetical protein